MNFVPILGLTAATLTTVCQIPQLLKIWKLKESRDVSLATYSVLSTGILLWLIYGILINNPPLYLANALTLITTLAIVGLKIKFG